MNVSEESVFAEAQKIRDPQERAAFLDRVCAENAGLRRSVASLLSAYDAGCFLERPAQDVGATADSSPGQGADQAADPEEKASTASLLAEGPGTVIGRYKLLQQIGEGGMGIVYMAEQQQPVRRKVALKIIKPGLDSRQVITRFEAERQALALMDHQNIAKVFDAGATDSGRPYFVMELVHGVPITQYCDDHHLTPKQRLELFLPVCHAIQHAHQKGVIHRDLKPSNVLVCLYDGVAVPKVIDFGVAKATGQPLTERTMFTQFGSLVGTLEYMSPEQAEMSQLGIDTRSDVYSLGVLLYELLTGTTPLQRHRLREAGFDEIRRLIREEEPPKPSTRLSTSGVALAAISAQRHMEPAKLTKLVRGELDWIVMKALEKERNRRYETANGLARDVERYLHDEPVEACPPTAGYKLRKFARKHQRLLATAAAFAALLLLGLAGSAWQAVRATQAETVANANAVQAQEKEHEANQQRDDAQKQRDEVRVLNEKLQATQAQMRGTLYTAHMNLAKHAWDEAAVSRVRELLEQHRPKPGEPDLRGFEWHYLHRLCHDADPLLTLKLNDFPDSVAFSPDGKRLVGATTGGTARGKRVEPELKVWDTQTGQEILTLQGASYGSLAFSPDGKRLASGSKVWDAQTGQVLLSLTGHTGDVLSVAFSPDGKRLASGSGDRRNEGKPGEVKVWDAQTGQELLTLKGATGDVTSVAFSPDGKRLAHGISGGLKDGKRVPGVVKVWDAQTGQELLTLQGGGRSVAFSPDGKRLASRSGGRRQGAGELKVWDAQTGQEIPSLHEYSDGSILFAFSPDGKRLATAGQRSGMPRIKVCDTETGRELFTFQRHTGSVSSLAFSPDSKYLASSGDRTVRIWDLQSGQEIRTLNWETIWLGSVAFSPDGKRLAGASADAGGSWDYTVRVWDAQKAPPTRTLTGDHAVFSPDFRRLAGASSDNTVKLWDAQTGQELLTCKGHTNHVWKVAFSPDGKRLASASRQSLTQGTSELKVWDAQTGQELLSLQGHTNYISSVVFSPDGQRLASLSYGEVKVWDARTGQELLSLKRGPGTGSGPYASLAFSPDGQRLASGSKVWDAQTGQELLNLKGAGASVAYSPDGKRLASAALDGTVRVWEAQTGQILLSFQGGHTYVLGVAFSPDGKRLASASTDRTVKLWDAQTGQETLVLKGHPRTVGSDVSGPETHNVAFSPDGHRLGSAFWDGAVTIWDATPLPQKP